MKTCRNRQLLLAALCAFLVTDSPPALAEDDPPFELTEERERCDHYDPLKQPFFGETHIHTAYSFDASAERGERGRQRHQGREISILRL